MAEGLVNHFLKDRWKASSAGTQPAGIVHPFVQVVLSEIYVEHHGSPKSVDQFIHEDFDLVVTVCDDAAENCPVWLGKGKRIHLGFPDPARIQDSREEQLAAFRSVRDAIRNTVIPYLDAWKEPSENAPENNPLNA
jgi:arsenate reductase